MRAGLNFYLETHVDRVTEDPAALLRLFELTQKHFEVNGAFSRRSPVDPLHACSQLSHVRLIYTA